MSTSGHSGSLGFYCQLDVSFILTSTKEWLGWGGVKSEVKKGRMMNVWILNEKR